jgi:mannose-6-phosphate isomerase
MTDPTTEDSSAPTAGPGRPGAEDRSTAVRPMRMVNPIRDYDWGSRTRIADLQRRPPAEGPEAELWMGAHFSTPSSVVDDDGREVPLTTWIERSPAAVLGAETLTRFGPRLPFLLKVLGIERALSVQLHPSAELAERGFAAEEAQGIPRAARERTYVDRYPKPEFFYALTPFVALAGFRPAAEVDRLLRALDLPVLEPVLAALARPGRHGGVVAALTTLLHWPAAGRIPLADQLASRSAELSERHPDAELATLLGWVHRLAGQHPGDPLITAPLLMRLYDLERGGTMFLPAGVPHVYLRGTCVEIMGNSDNVLRAGLTSKHISVDDLLEALDPDTEPVLGLPSHRSGGEQHAWDFPVDEFSLGHIVVGPGDGEHATTPTSPLPHILLCTRGQVTLHCETGDLSLRSGESAFVPAGCPGLTVRGDGEVFRAAPGIAQALPGPRK